jgi:hypothetical protein
VRAEPHEGGRRPARRRRRTARRRRLRQRPSEGGRRRAIAIRCGVRLVCARPASAGRRGVGPVCGSLPDCRRPRRGQDQRPEAFEARRRRLSRREACETQAGRGPPAPAARRTSAVMSARTGAGWSSLGCRPPSPLPSRTPVRKVIRRGRWPGHESDGEKYC